MGSPRILQCPTWQGQSSYKPYYLFFPSIEFCCGEVTIAGTGKSLAEIVVTLKQRPDASVARIYSERDWGTPKQPPVVEFSIDSRKIPIGL
jgi:hypothetical protein